MLYIFSDSNTKFRISNSIEVERLELKKLARHKANYNDINYVDISTLNASSQTKIIKKLQTLSKKTYCGIIDPKNMIKDPAKIFFVGLHDYIGKDLCKEIIDQKRIKAIKDFADYTKICPVTKPKVEKDIHVASFPGWSKIRKGVVYEFCFLYVRIEAEIDMKSRLGNERHRQCLQELNKIIMKAFAKANPHLWVETESGIIYLLPAKAKEIQQGIMAALKMQASAPIISYEKLRLPFLANFVFAMHVGTSEYAPKGKTGKIVSEALNFIYHLGMSKSNKGRITVSQETYDIFQTPTLNDIFVSRNSFEGHSLLQSKRFTFSNKCKY